MSETATTAAQDKDQRIRVDLCGVPETMLWPLWNRAADTESADPLIVDPLAAKIAASIDYDFAGRFGKPTIFHSIRARVCDDLIRRFSQQRRDRLFVVALGEGLETQYWRLAELSPHWISVDLPEALEVRRQLLPPDKNIREVPCSALDLTWMDAVPADSTPFISAAGLMMYFEETDVRQLLGSIAKRFPGAQVFFDTITPHISQKTLTGWNVTKSYQTPPMPWGITLADLPAFVNSIARLEAASIVSYVDVYPTRTRLYNVLGRIGFIRRRYASALVHAKVVTNENHL